MTTNHAPQSIAHKFNCQPCDFKCSKKNEWARHIATRKHQHATKYNEIAPKQYNCDCGKTYNHRASLYNHKKKCKSIPTVEDNIVLDNNITLTQSVLYNKDNTMIDHNALTLMVVELIKSNQELQKQMLEVCKVSTSTTNNNNNNNNHNNNNKTFNMHFFLNEQCKDAMNIMEFVDTFKLDFADLEKVGEVGYVEGMSNIIIKKLNEMDIYKRPIHCSDAKRETTFVKDKNVWEKENGTHDRLRLAIRHISKKNTDMLLSWCDAHPGACDSDNYLNDIYIEMVRQAMGGRDLVENENKIMRKIGLSCLIDKQHF